MGVRVLASIGFALLRTVGLNPARISTESEARFPGSPTWADMDYQKTGLGEKRTTIEARTAPHVFGGLDALQWLILHHERQDTVPYIRLGAGYSGLVDAGVVIRGLYYDETRLHPRDGVGRILDVEVDLLHVGRRA